MLTLVMLESAAILVSFLAALEMWRQRMPWHLILISFLIMVAILNALIHGWRGL